MPIVVKFSYYRKYQQDHVEVIVEYNRGNGDCIKPVRKKCELHLLSLYAHTVFLSIETNTHGPKRFIELYWFNKRKTQAKWNTFLNWYVFANWQMCSKLFALLDNRIRLKIYLENKKKSGQIDVYELLEVSKKLRV